MDDFDRAPLIAYASLARFRELGAGPLTALRRRAELESAAYHMLRLSETLLAFPAPARMRCWHESCAGSTETHAEIEVRGADGSWSLLRDVESARRVVESSTANEMRGEPELALSNAHAGLDTVAATVAENAAREAFDEFEHGAPMHFLNSAMRDSAVSRSSNKKATVTAGPAHEIARELLLPELAAFLESALLADAAPSPLASAASPPRL